MPQVVVRGTQEKTLTQNTSILNKGGKENNSAPIPIEIEGVPVLPKPQTLSQDHEKLCCTKENQLPRASINHPTKIKGENLERNER